MKLEGGIAALAFLWVPTSAWAEPLGGASANDVSLVRVFLALFVCLILAILAILLVRYRLSGKAPSFLPRFTPAQARIRLVESRRISAQAELSLVECDGSEYLLLLAAGGPLLLREGKAKAASKGQG